MIYLLSFFFATLKSAYIFNIYARNEEIEKIVKNIFLEIMTEEMKRTPFKDIWMC